MAGSLRGGRSPFSMPTFSCNLPVRAPPSDGTMSSLADPGLTISLGLPITPLPVGCGERARIPTAGEFVDAICSKWERREDTGFCRGDR